MPGRTPSEAFDNFVGPLQEAVSCMRGAGKIVAGPKARVPGGVRVWSLGGDAGMGIRSGWHLDAQMRYELINEEGVWRASTRAYRYKLSRIGEDVFRIHWHPWGNSPYKAPHVHLPLVVPKSDESTIDKHMPTGRMTFEEAIEWAINIGVPTGRDDWRDVLDASRARHVEHRTWVDKPPSLDE